MTFPPSPLFSGDKLDQEELQVQRFRVSRSGASIRRGGRATPRQEPLLQGRLRTRAEEGGLAAAAGTYFGRKSLVRQRFSTFSKWVAGGQKNQ